MHQRVAISRNINRIFMCSLKILCLVDVAEMYELGNVQF